MESISNRQLTLLRKLAKKKYRTNNQLFLVEGERAVGQVLNNRAVRVKHLFWDKSQHRWSSPAWQEISRQVASASVREDDYRKLTDTENPQGVLALCEMPPEADLDTMARKEGIIVATDRLQDPGNLGTIIRTAAWFNAAGLLLGKGTVDLFNPKVVRSTAGSTGTLPFANVDLQTTFSSFVESGWQILLLDASGGAENLRTLTPPSKTILVIGNEANGVDPVLFGGAARSRVEIPSPAAGQKVESLNASIALSIALYALSG